MTETSDTTETTAITQPTGMSEGSSSEIVAVPSSAADARNWRQGWRDLMPEYPQVMRRTVQTPVEASWHQRRLWFLAQMESGSAAYHVPLAWRITESLGTDLDSVLDSDLLRRCLGEVVARHQALRTTFLVSPEDGLLLQVIHPKSRIEWRTFDVSLHTESQREAELQNLLKEDMARAFDLVEGPLVRGCLVRVAEHEFVFLLTIHHIVFDGPSTEVLANELSHLYGVWSAKQSPSLAPLPVQYPDFAVWQRERLRGELLEKQLKFWSEELRAVPTPLEMAPAAAREQHAAFSGSQLSCVLDPQLSAGFEALARSSGVTLFMALLALYETLLFRYTGEADFVVGSPIANRNRAELRGLIGFFANTLALRSSCHGDPTFRQLLERVRERCLAAFANQEVPFDAVVERIHPERRAGVNPVFQSMFSLELPNWRLLDLPGQACQEMPVHNGFTKFDLVCVTAMRRDGLHLSVEYSRSRFDEQSIRSLMQHFGNLMESVLANPDQPLSQLRMLGAAEQQRVTVEWNHSALDLPPFPSIPAMFEAQVSKTPDQIALSDAASALTFCEVNERANSMACRLRDIGVGIESRVGVCAVASINTIVGLLAILKAGGTYVYLDPEHPADRLAFMIADAGIRVIVGPEVQHKLPGFTDAKGTTVWFDDPLLNAGALAAEGTTLCGDELTLDHAAYVVYTSGSTGRPKGVVALHRGVINRCAWMWHQYPMTPDEVCCIRTSLNFVDSIREIFGALLWGVRAVVASPRQSRNVDELLALVARERVTRLALVPSMLRAMLELRECVELMRCVRYWFVGGEALEQDLVEWFQRTLPEAMLLNVYGSSEDAGDVTCCDLRQPRPRGVVPIGRPIANTLVYVLDSHHNPVPVGIRGELYVGGAGIERGYLNQPELTAAKFIPIPPTLATWSVNHLFRTGDLARWLPDGQIECLGRADHQVKIRGFRVELEEVETSLRLHPLVQQAVVVVQPFGTASQLVGYLVLRETGTASAEDAITDIQRFLKARAPDYMVPSAFVVLEQLPLTPTGKVDRGALPLPLPRSGQGSSLQSAAEPGTATEAVIAQVWREVLGLDRVFVDSNFFDMGGHSLLLVRVQRRLADVLHAQVSLNDLFRYPSIRALADHVDGGQQERTDLDKARSAGERQKQAMEQRRRKREMRLP